MSVGRTDRSYAACPCQKCEEKAERKAKRKGSEYLPLLMEMRTVQNHMGLSEERVIEDVEAKENEVIGSYLKGNSSSESEEAEGTDGSQSQTDADETSSEEEESECDNEPNISNPIDLQTKLAPGSDVTVISFILMMWKSAKKAKNTNVVFWDNYEIARFQNETLMRSQGLPPTLPPAHEVLRHILHASGLIVTTFDSCTCDNFFYPLGDPSVQVCGSPNCGKAR